MSPIVTAAGTSNSIPLCFNSRVFGSPPKIILLKITCFVCAVLKAGPQGLLPWRPTSTKGRCEQVASPELRAGIDNPITSSHTEGGANVDEGSGRPHYSRPPLPCQLMERFMLPKQTKIFHFHFSSPSFVRLVNVLKHFSVFSTLVTLKSLKPLHVSA
jgi:hypothetical protein